MSIGCGRRILPSVSRSSSRSLIRAREMSWATELRLNQRRQTGQDD
jgi:hypothetical protein